MRLDGEGPAKRFGAAIRPVRRRVGPALACAALMAVLCAGMVARVHADDDPRRVAPYAATDDEVTAAMLDLAAVQPGDLVVDLGSGDGRIVIAAARRGANGLGVELDPKLVELARRSASAAGVESRTRFVHGDLFDTDVADASVVTLYLFPTIMGRVGEKLAGSLRPGARVVSHDFPLPGWRAQRIVRVDAPAKRDATGTATAALYLYAIPASLPSSRSTTAPGLAPAATANAFARPDR